jgi:excisionase family DNA binding protein
MAALMFGKKEAAEALSLSVRSVERMLARGELTFVRCGRRVLIPSAALEAFARRAQAASSAIGAAQSDGGK